MLYVHENNIDTKRTPGNDYYYCEAELLQFKNNQYLPMRNAIEAIDFSLGIQSFIEATNIINEYIIELHQFAVEHSISSQSKFESTYLEEISCYLFKHIPTIENGQLAIFNKGIYAGLKINEDLSIGVITKDVDFCIGKSISLRINNQQPTELIIPAVSVEVKTYLDATMFGEVKSSSKTIKSSTPDSKAYVLMGYKALKDEHILAARQDSTLDEMFVLKANKNAPIDANVLYEYYREIVTAISSLATPPTVTVPGRLLKYVEGIYNNRFGN